MSRLWELISREIPPRTATPRMADLDAARGVAIFLVVLGHLVAEEMPVGVDWYPTLRSWVYRFHMPLFMVLTGVTFALSLPQFKGWSEVWAFSWRKTSRLLVPYVFFGLFVLAGKLFAARFFHVDNVPTDPWLSALNLLWRPSSSAAGFLWFIYVLAIYFLTLPALFHLIGRRPIVLLGLGLTLQLGRWPDAMALNSVMFFLPWFAAGMMMWVWRDAWARLPVGPMLLIGLGWLGASLWTSMQMRPDIRIAWASALSVPVVLCAVQQMSSRWQEIWAWIGQRSLALYLMNTMVIGLFKALLLKVMPWDGANFFVFFAVCLIAGMAIPLGVKEVISRKVPALNNYV